MSKYSYIVLFYTSKVVVEQGDIIKRIRKHIGNPAELSKVVKYRLVNDDIHTHPVHVKWWWGEVISSYIDERIATPTESSPVVKYKRVNSGI